MKQVAQFKSYSAHPDGADYLEALSDEIKRSAWDVVRQKPSRIQSEPLSCAKGGKTNNTKQIGKPPLKTALMASRGAREGSY